MPEGRRNTPTNINFRRSVSVKALDAKNSSQSENSFAGILAAFPGDFSATTPGAGDCPRSFLSISAPATIMTTTMSAMMIVLAFIS
jgi:hypothetical protein